MRNDQLSEGLSRIFSLSQMEPSMKVTIIGAKAHSGSFLTSFEHKISRVEQLIGYGIEAFPTAHFFHH